MMTPTQIDKHSATAFLLAWSSGERFVLPFKEVRYQCPCAGCVDEHTGQRTLKKDAIAADIHPESVQLIGRYAIQINWSDRHDTGMYHFDRLYDLCLSSG